MYKLVLLKILAALSNVSGHVEKVNHGQAGRLLLNKQKRQNCIFVSIYEAASIQIREFRGSASKSSLNGL